MNLTREFLNIIKDADGFSARKAGNGAILIPPKSKYFFTPRIVIRDLEMLENALRDYINAVQSTNLNSTNMDEKHDIPYFYSV